MTRIQFADLPRLQDLTEEQLKELFGAGRFRPALEQLEDRLVRSTLSYIDYGSSIGTDTTLTSAFVDSTTDQTIIAYSGDTVAQQTDPYAALLVEPYQQTGTETDQALIDAFGQSVLSNNLRDQGQIAIAQKVTQLGASLESPLDSAYLNTEKPGKMPTGEIPTGMIQDFLGGKSIYWSPATGAHLVTGLILDRYRSEGETHWGYPKTDDVVFVGDPGDVRVVNDFRLSGGHGIASIVWSSQTVVGPKVVMGGAIWSEWVRQGATASLVPLTDVYDVQDGHGQEFFDPRSGGYSTIVESAQTGAHLMSGDIRLEWVRLGQEWVKYGLGTGLGAYGLPSDDVQQVSDQIGFRMYQDFSSNGWVNTIIRSDLYNSDGRIFLQGFFHIEGAIRKLWGDLGGLGWGTPISNPTWSADGKSLYNEFLAPVPAGSITPGSEVEVSRIRWIKATGKLVIESNVRTFTATQALGDSGMSPAPQGFAFSDPATFGSTPATPAGAIDPDASYQQVASLSDTQWAQFFSPDTTGINSINTDNFSLLSQAIQPVQDTVALPTLYAFLSPGSGFWAQYAPAQDLTAVADYDGISSQAFASFTPFSDLTTPIEDYASITGALTGSDLYQPTIDWGDYSEITPYVTVPRLDSNPGAANTIFLDFQSFSTADEKREIWQRVAEDFAPFNVNVTTDWKGALDDRSMLRVVVGNQSVAGPFQGMADPYGLSQFDAMKQGGPNVVHVFADGIRALGGNFATLAANVASREAGHAFGLRYQLQTDSTSGVSDVTPQANIMGTRIGVELTRWAEEAVAVPSDVSPNAWAWQDDLKILTGVLGFREQGPGGYGGFTNLGSVEYAGILQGNGTIILPFAIQEADNPGPAAMDVDTYIFDTQGGRIHFAVQGIGAGQNLGAHFEVWGLGVKIGESPTPYGDLNAALRLDLPAGTYFVKVMGGTGSDYGNFGRYTLTIQTDAHYFSRDYGSVFQTRSAFAPDQSQTRLVELDQLIAESQQELQGALDLQAQHTADRERFDAEIQAAADVSSDEAAPNLADLQAGLLQIMAALEQDQQQIADLQSQIDLYTAERTLLAAAMPVRRDDWQARLDEINQSLAQTSQDLQAAQDALAQADADAQQLVDQIQTATDAVASADQTLASLSARLTQAQNNFSTAQHSALAFKVQEDRKTALQTSVNQANDAYQNALKLQKSNHDPSQIAHFKQVVKDAKLALTAAQQQAKLQTKTYLAAQKLMLHDAPTLAKASAALDLAQSAFDAASQISDQSALTLADLLAKQTDAATARAAAEQHIAELQARVDQLTAEQAEAASQLVQADLDAAVPPEDAPALDMELFAELPAEQVTVPDPSATDSQVVDETLEVVE